MVKKMWGGRFAEGIDPAFERFSSSIAVDHKLARADLMGSLLHVHVLKEAKLISAAELSRFKKGILCLLKDVASGRFKFDFTMEDVHTNIQCALGDRIGGLVEKLQTCRSRNDQVVFATKLTCFFAATEISQRLLRTRLSLIRLSGLHEGWLIPGYTHLQHAQAVYLKDYLAAYEQMFGRDAARLEDAVKRFEISMGAGALAGTSIPRSCYAAGIQKGLAVLKLSVLTKYIHPVVNPMSVVSDRDFAIEFLSVLANTAMHMSRLAEDLILWSTKEFGFVALSDAYCTGSSLMPQKKNPDSLELIRGAAGPVYGGLMSVLTTMKGLPLSYNRDMQWDKPALFASIDIVRSGLEVLAGTLCGARFKKTALSRQLEDESLTATDLADLLVSRGVSFRKAHEVVGKLVRTVLDQGRSIRELSEKELKGFAPEFTKKDVLTRLDPAFGAALRKRARSI